jgi:hypothetical protein
VRAYLGLATVAAECAQAIATEFLNNPTVRPPSAGCVAQRPQYDYTP